MGQDSHNHYIADLVRNGDRERYLSAILAPGEARLHLMALYAFDLDLQSIPAKISEPIAGEFRIQWWRDWLAGLDAEKTTGNPVADALAASIANEKIETSAISSLLDAWSHVFHGAAPADLGGMETLLRALEDPVFNAAVNILGAADVGGETAHLVLLSGYRNLLRSFGTSRIVASQILPREMTRKHDFALQSPDTGTRDGAAEKIASELRDQANSMREAASREFAEVPQILRPAYACLAPVISALAKSAGSGELGLPAINPLASQWEIWRAVKSGRF